MAIRSHGASRTRQVEEPPGCDTADLFRVHRIMRWLYRELPVLIREVAPGDADRVRIVADYAVMDLWALELHHSTEDAVLWDRIAARAPACALHVDRMRAQHAEVAAQIAAIEPLIPPWRSSADATGRDELATRVEHLRDTLFAHLGEEETDVVPVAAEVLTQSEWNELEQHAMHRLREDRGRLPRDIMALQAGLMLATVPEDDREAFFRENFPLPARALYLVLLRRRYEHAMAELYPDRPVPAMA
ncbi:MULTISPECIES: hemerythrin domain-containing protein [unclassified Agromyces]|uniref:hemerythrin domain-containing protein n=1 Tax=unclassified Agromyces TaxID=2639701 RepID=UPI0030156B98